jgi:methionyl-tRNA formyltransferase
LKSRILFLGTGALVRTLMEVVVLNNESEILGLITSAKEISMGKSKEPIVNVHYTDLENFCSKHKIRYEIVSHLDSNKYLDEVISILHPDIVFVAGWHRLISDSLLSKSNFYGFHASLLPKNAGWAPLVWALINGEKETGVSLFKIDSGIDTGPLIDQIKFPINENTTIHDLVDESIKISRILLERNIKIISKGIEKLTPQDLTKRTEGIRRVPSDGEINFCAPVRYVDRFIRAQTRPYFGSYTDIDQKRIRIFKSAIVDPSFKVHQGEYIEPGSHKVYNDQYFFKCLDGWIQLLDFEVEELRLSK